MKLPRDVSGARLVKALAALANCKGEMGTVPIDHAVHVRDHVALADVFAPLDLRVRSLDSYSTRKSRRMFFRR